MSNQEPPRSLTDNELSSLEKQDSRLVSEFKADKFANEASKHWDIFYKRNETKFFKDRHWTTREFRELTLNQCPSSKEVKVLLEVGCGVGNFLFPLLEEEGEQKEKLFIHACDFSPRAIDFVKSHPKYKEDRVHAFVHDVTSLEPFEGVSDGSVDIVSMVFVLSAIQPKHFHKVFSKIHRVLRPGGVFIFRDYGLYDMAMLRFKPGTKIQGSQYLRQDGTLTYFFSTEEMETLARESGFETTENHFVHRRTVNKKEEVDVPRIFIQGKFSKAGNNENEFARTPLNSS